MFFASSVVSLYSFKCLIHLKLCLLNGVRWKKAKILFPLWMVVQHIKWLIFSSLIVKKTTLIILYILYLSLCILSPWSIFKIILAWFLFFSFLTVCIACANLHSLLSKCSSLFYFIFLHQLYKVTYFIIQTS